MSWTYENSGLMRPGEKSVLIAVEWWFSIQSADHPTLIDGIITGAGLALAAQGLIARAKEKGPLFHHLRVELGQDAPQL